MFFSATLTCWAGPSAGHCDYVASQVFLDWGVAKETTEEKKKSTYQTKPPLKKVEHVWLYGEKKTFSLGKQNNIGSWRQVGWNSTKGTQIYIEN